MSDWKNFGALAAVSALTVALLVQGAAAQEAFPERAITFVVPFSPGGGNDTLARVVTAKAGEFLGAPIVVENRPGAGGGVAAELVADAAPDGYTLLQGNIAHAINMSLYAEPGYDISSDFAPVTLMATAPLLLCVNPDLGVDTLEELITMTKSRPGELTYGSSGIGGASNMAMELLKSKAGIDLLHIPYQGSGPSVTDLIAGRLDVALPALSSAPPLMAAGEIVCLGSTSSKRSDILPDMPTIAEASGIADYEALPWYGILAPAGTDSAIVDKIAASVKKALADPQVRDVLTTQGFDVVGNTPEEFASYIGTEVAKWAAVVEESGVTDE